MDALYDFPAGSWNLLETNIAPLDCDTGANARIQRNLFDDSTIEWVGENVIVLPPDLDASGTVTFELWGYAVTAYGAGTTTTTEGGQAPNDVVFYFHHDARQAGESWDQSTSAESSGQKTCQTGQDELDKFSWTETVSNLGWAAGDHVRVKLLRKADDVEDDLVGDYGVTHFRIRVPRS